MQYVLYTALVMTVPWVGLSWLGWHNSKQMRAVFPGGQGRLFLAILLATMPWFLGPSLLILAGDVVEAISDGEPVASGPVLAVAVVFSLAVIGAVVASRKLVGLYMRLRAAQQWGDLEKEAAQ